MYTASTSGRWTSAADFSLLMLENKKMQISIRRSLAAQQICFLGNRITGADLGKQPHFSIWNSNQIGRDRNYLSGKEKKKENNNKAKGKKKQTTYNLKTYRGALFISIRVKMEQEFRRLCCSFFLFLNDSIFLESGYAAGLHIAFAAAASSEMLVVFVSLEVSWGCFWEIQGGNW